MPWFKSDDSFWRHPKVRKLGRDKLPAVGLWELAGTWCADNVDTNVADGFVPDEQVTLWDPRHRYAKRLVDVGLWNRTEVDGESGYMFHDWADYQPTRATVEAEREAWRERKAEQRRKRKTGTSTEVSPRDTNGDTTVDSRKTPHGSHNTPGPGPVPGPVPSNGHLGEGHSPTERDGETPTPSKPLDGPRPADRCDRHLGDDDPPPCRACRDARLTAEAWDTSETERAGQVTRDIEAAIADPRMRCEHGTDGGLHLHPITGKSATCALCRLTPKREAS
ncbi:hypothetical protein [Prauserella cavernicola]|uniref:Uncharacterized protein n=1 Tax=Prauserella cavernicola TaxID=2800127 RepID=A0A934QS07_9PSEU|nr:hypothetical protein [Prauserella cavernicola]MBK1785118.1 hypothetical protein [Prauserella cavernicola]